MKFDLASVIKSLGPEGANKGTFLMLLNVIAMVFAALSNTYAVVVDKNTSPEDKKFLVPAGLATGVANIGTYYLITDRIIKSLKEGAENFTKSLSEADLQKNALDYVTKLINKAETSSFKGIRDKMNPNYISDMKEYLKNGDLVSNAGIKLYKDNLKSGATALGALAGVVIGCGVLTPLIRDISAFAVQKHMEKKNPSLKDMPYKPYFDPAHLKVSHNVETVSGQKIPLTMKNYMAFTNGSMKI